MKLRGGNMYSILTSFFVFIGLLFIVSFIIDKATNNDKDTNKEDDNIIHFIYKDNLLEGYKLKDFIIDGGIYASGHYVEVSQDIVNKYELKGNVMKIYFDDIVYRYKEKTNS
jgi:hypothetical protein